MSMRRAILLSTGERYFGMLVNFASIAAISRLLTPQEVGLMAVGVALTNLIEMLRDLGATAFVIQSQSQDRDVPRTAFTLMAMLTLAAALPLFFAAPTLAALYGDLRLVPLLQILAFVILPGPLLAIPFAIMRRDMAFALPAGLGILTTATVAILTIVFAVWGVGYLSSAYAFLIGNVLVAATLLVMRRDMLWIFRPTLSKLREVLHFGGYSAVAGVLQALHEFLPNVYLGRLLGLDALGHYNRAIVAYSLPDKLILTGFLPVALPAFSALVRDGHSLKHGYLRALDYLSAVKIPVHILFAILAEPIVRVLLGPQWTGVIPLIQLMSLASIINFPSVLLWPVCVAGGAVNLYLRSQLITMPLSAVMIWVAAHYGLIALAWTYIPSMALITLPGVYYVYRVTGFTWTELGASIWKSVVITVVSMAAPAGAYLALDHISTLQAVAIGVVAGAGWLVGLWLTGHPLLDEVRHLRDALLRVPAARRLLANAPAAWRPAQLPANGSQGP